jgi:hypothetical protein
MSKINTLLDKLEKVRRVSEGKWSALCPAHGDKRPSLGIKLTDDDKILLHCWCGCSVSEIVGAIGMNLSDLMPERPQGYDRTRSRAPRFSKSEMFDRLLHESTVLSLAVRKLRSGQAMTDVDTARVVQAETIIDNLRREVAR